MYEGARYVIVVLFGNIIFSERSGSASIVSQSRHDSKWEKRWSLGRSPTVRLSHQVIPDKQTTVRTCSFFVKAWNRMLILLCGKNLKNCKKLSIMAKREKERRVKRAKKVSSRQFQLLRRFSSSYIYPAWLTPTHNKYWQHPYLDSLSALFQHVEWDREILSQGKFLRKWAQIESR